MKFLSLRFAAGLVLPGGFLFISLPSAAAPVVARINPAAWVSTTTLNGVVINGANFAAGATVTLSKTGHTPIVATNVAVLSASSITCSLPLTGAGVGQWTVTVTNSDTSSGTLNPGFIVGWDIPESLRVWASTDSMSFDHGIPGEILLPNGKVLAAGGNTAMVELYDPATGHWSATGPLSTIRQGGTFALMANGKVLAAGGSDGEFPPTDPVNAEVYDPGTGLWTTIGSIGTGRTDLTATLLPNGKVLLAGGMDQNTIVAGLVNLYDPGTNSMSAATAMGVGRTRHTATLLPNGKVLVAGGSNGSSYLASAELYDPVGNSWTAAGSMSETRSSFGAALLPNGKVLAAGGVVSGGYTTSSADLYDPVSNTWSPTTALLSARQSFSTTLLPNGKVLAAGGIAYSGSWANLASAEYYDPVTGLWSAAPALPGTRATPSAALLPSGKVLVLGGDAAGKSALQFEAILAVSGKVKYLGAGLGGVTVSVSGDVAATTITAADGTYSFNLDYTLDLTVTPAYTSFPFSPVSISSLNPVGNLTGRDFAVVTSTASGFIRKNGLGLAGVTVAVTGSTTAASVTAADGSYSIELPYGLGYILKPALAGNSFSPALLATGNLAGDWPGQDFSVLAAGDYTVSGKIKQDGAGVSGVTVAVSGSLSATATTAADGSYSLNLPAGNYVVTPSKAGSVFWPANYTLGALGGNIPDKDFTVTSQATQAPVLVQGGENGFVEPKKAPATIRLAAPAVSGHVTVKIYTLRGARLVKTIETDVVAGAPAALVWNCLNTDGEMIGSGTYLAVVNGAGYNNVKVKIGVLK